MHLLCRQYDIIIFRVLLNSVPGLLFKDSTWENNLFKKLEHLNFQYVDFIYFYNFCYKTSLFKGLKSARGHYLAFALFLTIIFYENFFTRFLMKFLKNITIYISFLVLVWNLFFIKNDKDLPLNQFLRVHILCVKKKRVHILYKKIKIELPKLK
jgi:hypothetical protein